jgi:hypothetical protein
VYYVCLITKLSCCGRICCASTALANGPTLGGSLNAKPALKKKALLLAAGTLLSKSKKPEFLKGR